ncbi:hypothetical protein WICPIJ_000361 [Wickerhamomyces pijperi]|uniref:PIN domain-like protein n=2 Tax=Wickerhamomyces TaxID=599737 RepID=A0A9P8TS21_WICPI|nr:hypothetical protein WICPIJ_000361 [Wickerhamomyces pijperi]
MGVHNLWQILEPTSQPTPLDQLQGKRLAIDASIWIYQFLRLQHATQSSNSNSVISEIQSARRVLQGFFHRCCKLSYFGIRPVFVFDGVVTRLKKDTIRERRERREKIRDEKDKLEGEGMSMVARRLLGVEIQRMKNKGSSPEKKRKREDEGESNRFQSTDQYHLPKLEGFHYDEWDERINADHQKTRSPTPGLKSPTPTTSASASSSAVQAADPDSLYNDLEGVDLHTIDPSSAEFANLSDATQYLVLSQLRLHSRLRMGYSKDQLQKSFPSSLDFSKFQIEMVGRRNYYTQRLMGISGMDTDSKESKERQGRISGVKGKEYKLTKVDGGWALGLSEGETIENAIDLTKDDTQPKKQRKAVKKSQKDEEDDDEEGFDDWEDVDLTSKTNDNSNGKKVKVDYSISGLPLPPMIDNYEVDEEISGMKSFMVSPMKTAKKQSTTNNRRESTDALLFEDEQLQRYEDEELEEAVRLSELEAIRQREIEERKMKQDSTEAYDEFAGFEDVPLELSATDSTMKANEPVPPPPIFSLSTKSNTTDNVPKKEETPFLLTTSDINKSSVFTPESELTEIQRQQRAQRQDSRDREMKEMSYVLGLDNIGTKSSKEPQPQTKKQDPDTLFSASYTDEEPQPHMKKPWERDALEIDSDDEERSKRRSKLQTDNGKLQRRPNATNTASIQTVDNTEAEERHVPSVPSWFNQEYVPLRNTTAGSGAAAQGASGKPATDSDGTSNSVKRNLISSLFGGEIQSSQHSKFNPSAMGASNTLESRRELKKQDEALGLMSYSEMQDMINRKKDAETLNSEGFVEVVDLSDEEEKDDKDDDRKTGETETADKEQENDKQEEDEADDDIIWEDVDTGKKTDGASSIPNDSDSQAKDPTNGYDYEFSEDEETELQETLTKESESNAQFLESLAQTQISRPKQTIASFQKETSDLLSSHNKLQAQSTQVTATLTQQIQSLLTTFGIPYITAPTEAESQCAELFSLKLIDGIITDDSDVFLFGGDNIYRHFFAEKKYVTRYEMKRIRDQLDLDREKLIELACLLGSDYTSGVKGIGPVTAMQIIEKFSDLAEFRDWFQNGMLDITEKEESQVAENEKDKKWLQKLRRKLTNLPSLSTINESFPDPEVTNAYLNPEVDSDETVFKWGVLDLDQVREFMIQEVGWQREKCDSVLIPLVRDLNSRKRETKENGTQKGIGEFFSNTGRSGSARKSVKRKK